MKKMNREEMIEFLESAKTGKLKGVPGIWKIESGTLYKKQGDDWIPEPKPIFSEDDLLMCDEGKAPENYPGRLIEFCDYSKQREAIQNFGATPEEIESTMAKNPTKEEQISEVIKLINKLENE